MTKDIDHASVSGPKNDQTYTDPRYMVNIVTGASGDKEGETCVLAAGLLAARTLLALASHNPRPPTLPRTQFGIPCVVNVLPPSATCTADYGYGVWQAVNATYARWEFQSIKPDYIGPANYTDVVTFIKTKPVRGA